MRGVFVFLARRTPAAAGAIVMATAVVGLALRLAGRPVAGGVMLGLAGAVWLGVAALLAGRWALDRRGMAEETGRLPALTAVAGSAVLGSGLATAGLGGLALALWAIAAVLWVALLARLARRPPAERAGYVFLPAVATNALAALSATLAVQERAAWLAWLALVLVAAGLCMYLAGLSRFSPRMLRDGGGETWIAGGALAVAALACADLVGAVDALGVMRGARAALAGLDIGIWAAAMAWLPILVAAEARWPRPGYAIDRWSTAFPVGMYAACSLAAGAVLGRGPIADFGRAWVWVALAVWALTAFGLARRAPAARPGRPGHRGPRPRASG